MKILVVTQYFYPEEFLINGLVEEMVKAGHEVTVLTGKPNYPQGTISEGYRLWGVQKETLFGAQVIRVPLIPRGAGGGMRLMLNYFSFAISSSLYALFHRSRPDHILCWDTSPILQACAGIVSKLRSRRAKLSMWVQDLWPESVEAAGVRNKFIINTLTVMVRWIYRHFDTLFIQSPSFRRSIEEKGKFKAEYVWAPNWAPAFFSDERHVRRERYAHLMPQGFKVMFAGNVGVSQDFDSILQAARLTAHRKDIHWVIVGDGRYRKKAEALTDELQLRDTVHFLGRYPVDEMPSFFAHADAMLVSLRDEPTFALTIPSKTQVYMAAGKPILTMINGEGNRIVEEAGAGFTASAGDARQLADNVLRMASLPEEERKKMAAASRIYYKECFAQEKVITTIFSHL